jgi:hypothetical protein
MRWMQTYCQRQPAPDAMTNAAMLESTITSLVQRACHLNMA